MKKILMPLAMALLSVGIMSAATVGTQGFADIGAPTGNTGNINTSTTYALGLLLTTGSQSGDFAGMPTQIFGAETFDTAVPNSLSFGNAAFGSFTSTGFTEISNTPGSVAFYVLGNYTTGTYPLSQGASAGVAPASFTISFTQTPAGTGSISDSATFSIPPAPLGTPEPASMVLMGSAMIGLAMIRRRRKV